MSMDVEALSKACAQVGAGYTVYMTDNGMDFTPLKELVIIGDRAVLIPYHDEKENNL